MSGREWAIGLRSAKTYPNGCSRSTYRRYNMKKLQIAIIVMVLLLSTGAGIAVPAVFSSQTPRDTPTPGGTATQYSGCGLHPYTYDSPATHCYRGSPFPHYYPLAYPNADW